MELWIRGQDKLDLLKCKSIHIEEIPSSKEVAIICYASGDRYSTVGIYKTKERALEVLNEIQNLLNPILIYKNVTKDENSINLLNKRFGIEYFCTSNNADIKFLKDTIVYEMPKK